MTDRILLGYEIGTGEPVTLQPQHLAVTGQTQQSGKTTTLEALVSRSGATALTFITKRGEGSFADGRRITPYFRDRADWQFVTSILDAQLQEKNKFLRPWIIKLCNDTKTLADVQRKIRNKLPQAKGITEGVYVQLDAYLDLIVPEIKRAKLATTLDLRDGLNVMDVSSFDTPMQMLFVQSALDWVNAQCRNTVVVIPEAWEFIPEGKGSPVKNSAVALVRKGAGIGNYIWVDSQDMAGVDKTILRGCTTWLIGVQREANEIKRALSNIPAGIKKPNAADVALLERGQFFACFGKHCIKTYVRPVWVDERHAVAIATGAEHMPAAPHRQPAPPPAPEDPAVTPERADELERENERLKSDNRRMFDELAQLRTKVESLVRDRGPTVPAPTHQPSQRDSASPADSPLDDIPPASMAKIYDEVKRRAATDPGVLQLLQSRPEIVVTIERHTIEADGKSLVGHAAMLIVDKFFDAPVNANAAFKEMKRRGWSHDVRSIYRICDELAEMGFLTKEPGGYQAIADTKKDIRQTRG